MNKNQSTPPGTSSANNNNGSSPTSLIQQWKIDAKGAMEDAYASYVLGDDAGESARLVLVATPSDDLKTPTGGTGSKGAFGVHNRNDKHGTNHNNNYRDGDQRGGGGGGGASSPYHATQSLLLSKNGNTKSSKKLHATSFTSCGVTFCEINGRAYVSALDEASAAYKAGVLPQDCVQYAAVLAKEWEEPLDGDFEAISQQALEREDKGQRITFEELKRVLIQGSGLLTANGYGNHPHSIWMGPQPSRPVPSTIRIGRANPCGPMTATASTTTIDDDEDILYDSKGRAMTNTAVATDPRPVVLVFRRTRQRAPKAWNVWPNYRLDDECDVACQILDSLTSGKRSNQTSSSSPTKGKKKKSSLSPKRRRGRRRGRSSEGDNNDDGDYSEDDPFDDLDEGDVEEEHVVNNDHEEDDDTNVEASTIRGMIQKAVGLAFVRSNKVVFGVSVHGGSGIVMARLPDGTWSAPSCIGMVGMGLGLQVGLEVANYIFILQTKEALEHFQRGGSFTLGANVGAAFAGIGREAIGAASVSSALCGISSPVQVVKEDEYTYERDYDYNAKKGKGSPDGEAHLHTRGGGVSSVAPIVAYAKSEGLYVGVSLEGSRIFTRGEINARAYKMSSYNQKAVTASDILTGKILARPPEAENLYAHLHAIELTHELFSLPPLPRCDLVYGDDGAEDDWTKAWEASSPPIFRGEDHKDDDVPEKGRLRQEVDGFCEKFQDFLFGGITVQRITPHHRSKKSQRRQRRTLWLYAPQKGSMRLGFVSKLFSATSKTINLATSIIQDIPKNGVPSGRDGGSIISEIDGDDVTLDSALIDNQSLLTTTGTLREKVELSKKLSIDLVDIVSITQQVPPNVKLQHPSERSRVICVESADTQIIFIGRSLEETRLLFCGLKVLVEKETARLGVRGGIGKNYKNGRTIASAMKGNKKSPMQHQGNKQNSGYASSEIDDTDEPPVSCGHHQYRPPDGLPEGWKSWGRFPGRAYMRQQAASNDDGYPTYVHGQLLVRDLCKNVHLPLPLPLCRVLLLDSSSPVISKWENDRGDSDFEKTPWTFPPATPREMEQFQSEHQLIASGSMCGAHRTISYERYRNGQLVRLSETHIVDSDDSEKLAFQVNERLPRRGFSIKVKILLRAVENGRACEATVFGEIRPVGKNMSDPAAVHKAFMLVLEELRHRYGTESVGLLAGFMNVVENMPKGETNGFSSRAAQAAARFSVQRTSWEEKKESDHVKMTLDKTSVVKFEDVLNADQNLGVADGPDSDFEQERRPSTPSPKDIAEGKYKSRKTKAMAPTVEDTFDTPAAEPVTIEVKPLPKIRLSLMPSPREEDEENLDDEGEPLSKSKSLTSSSSSSKSKLKAKRSSWGDNKTKANGGRERNRSSRKSKQAL